MQSLIDILSMVVGVVWYVVIVHIVMSWLINFEVLNLRQPLVSQIWHGLNRLLEPLYSRIRSFLPPMGGLDFAPLIVLIGLMAIRIVLANNGAYYR